MSNPIDDMLQERDKTAEQVKRDDMHAWEQWKAQPNQQTMETLITRFDPLLKQKARLWKAPTVNDIAFLTHMRLRAAEAFQTYDPNKGAALRTHVENLLRRAHRYNAQHQNNAYLPEWQTQAIGKLDKSFDYLRDSLGRDPEYAEVAQHANQDNNLTGRNRLTAKKVERIMEGRRKDVSESRFDFDPTPHALQREQEVLSLLRPTLNNDQQQVFDHLYGLNGKPKVTSTSELGRLLGKTPSQVSRLRTGIKDQYEKYK